MLLVTTALEDTWGVDEEILFLGEWCKIYDRKDIWSKRSSKTLPDPWSDRSRRFSAYLHTEEVYSRTIESLSDALNREHNLDHPVRYWKILCGPWLRLFVTATYHYWECISDAIDTNQSLDSFKVGAELKSLIPIDMIDFENKMVSDSWNHHICSLIIDSLGFQISPRHINWKSNDDNSPSNFQQQSTKRKLISQAFEFAGRVFNKSTAIFISNPYISKLNQIKLSAKLRTFPSIVLAPQFIQKCDPYSNSRKSLLASNNASSAYEIFLNRIVLQHIPFVYLEGFSDLQDAVNSKRWSKYPSAIVTAVDHFSNDFFKFYSASKVILGSSLNIICHGGGGKYKYSDFQALELDLCDHFFTWGWSEYSSKCVQGFFIKDKGYRRTGNNEEKYLLHITLSKYRYQKFIDSTPSYEQYLTTYLDDQVKFLNSLEYHIKKETITKLSYDYQNSLENRINDKCTDVRYAQIGEDYYKLLKNAKLVVTTYNCTTPVESIAMNLPTIIFWEHEHWELAPSAIPFFQKLRACGVFHESPESAALMVNRIWSDINAWWQSEEVVAACSDFRLWFCRESNNQIEELAAFCELAPEKRAL